MAAVLLALGGPAPASAQRLFPGVDDVAEALVGGSGPRPWTGPRTPYPTERIRPEPAFTLESSLDPLAVHGGEGVDVRTAERALDALEAAHELLVETGWPAPWPDGGLGGTAGLDLYLVAEGRPAAAHSDGPLGWAQLDAVSAWALCDPGSDDLEANVASAYAQAALLGQDPAEAEAWRQATGAYVAWLVTGRFGGDGAVEEQQSEPWRSWIDGAAGDGAGGAYLLAMLSQRYDRGSGVFVRELWQLARQRTRDGTELRASPDLWEALERAVELRRERLRDVLEDLAVTRVRSALAPGTEVPVAWRTDWSALPKHSPPMTPELLPFGSAYAEIDVRQAPTDSLLRVWLRGEYGVEWSLIAVRLDANGRELGRVTAPPMRTARAYVPVELDHGTARVLVVGTNMSSRLPDADVIDENVRTFRLVADRGP